AGAAATPLCLLPPQPRLLDPPAQHEPALELDHDLRFPRRRVCGDVIHVEVVLILARLDEELEILFVPPGAAAARPDPQRLVLEEILVAFGRKPEVGLSPSPQP